MTATETPERQHTTDHHDHSPFAGYSDEDRPLASYAGLVGLFHAAYAGFVLLSKSSDKPLPERPSASDLVLLGVATHKLSRLIAKDWVTSFIRAPFTTYEGPAGPGEVSESPRGSGLQKALGELLTCPYCMGQWVAAAFSYGLVLKPRHTRLLGGMFALVAASDFLHLAYQAGRKKALSS